MEGVSGSFLQHPPLTASHALGDGDLSHLRDRSPSHQEGACPWGPDTHHKPTVDLLQDLLLIQRHGLPFPLFDPLLLQALAGIHFTRGPNLAGTDLRGKKEAKGTRHVKQGQSEAPSRPGCCVSGAWRMPGRGPTAPRALPLRSGFGGTLGRS